MFKNDQSHLSMHRHGASTVEAKAATQINLFSYCATPSRGLEKLTGIATFLRHYYSQTACLPPGSGREQMEQNRELVFANSRQAAERPASAPFGIIGRQDSERAGRRRAASRTQIGTRDVGRRRDHLLQPLVDVLR